MRYFEVKTLKNGKQVIVDENGKRFTKRNEKLMLDLVKSNK